jgi:hypothetical protein
MSTLVRQIQPAGPVSQIPAPASESAALILMIERAARDPAVDIEKMERLFKMHEEVTARNAKVAYDAALAAMQPKLPVIDRRGKITIRDKADREKVIQSTPYALFEDINEAVRPILAEHGFALSFRTGLAADGRVTVTGILSHRDGHREETTMVLPHDSTGSKNAVQAIGSSTSYGKRYTMVALLNITTKGEDDDGKAGGDSVITDEQAETLTTLIHETKSDIGKFLQVAGAESISDIPASQYGRLLKMLQNKKAHQK